MARKVYNIINPAYTHEYNRDTKRFEFNRKEKDLELECYWDNGIFAITKTLPGSDHRNKYTITHILTGMSAHGFNTMLECKECIKRFCEGTLVDVDSWAHVDTPQLLMYQVYWMGAIVKEMRGIK